MNIELELENWNRDGSSNRNLFVLLNEREAKVRVTPLCDPYQTFSLWSGTDKDQLFFDKLQVGVAPAYESSPYWLLGSDEQLPAGTVGFYKNEAIRQAGESVYATNKKLQGISLTDFVSFRYQQETDIQQLCDVRTLSEHGKEPLKYVQVINGVIHAVSAATGALFRYGLRQEQREFKLAMYRGRVHQQETTLTTEHSGVISGGGISAEDDCLLYRKSNGIQSPVLVSYDGVPAGGQTLNKTILLYAEGNTLLTANYADQSGQLVNSVSKVEL